MYPQAHAQNHALYSQQQHQSYPFSYSSSSSNPFLLSFHQLTFASTLSDSALHPPPHGNSSFSLSTQTQDSQNRILKEAEPITYDLAVGSSHEPSVVPASLHSWLHQIFSHDSNLVLPNQTKVPKPMRCEVCKIDCNGKDVYEKHISGKKHKGHLQVQTNPTKSILSGPSQASLQSQMSSVQGRVLIGAVGQELEAKKWKLLKGGAAIDSVRACTICNVVCNSLEVFSKHLAGKKHAAQVALMSDNGIGPYLAAFRRHGIGPWKKVPEKIRVAQPAWCAVCKINCNSKDVYIVHLSGKKHLRNLEKLSKSKNDAVTGATTANALQGATSLVIGPHEKPHTDKLKLQKAPEEDLEAKKLRVLEGGAAAHAVRSCTLCNVVCNSRTVFNAHLAGQKHAAMVKQQAESRGETTG